MAKVVKMNGATFLQPRWQDSDREWMTILNDNRRERRELNRIILQEKVDRLAKTL